MTDHSSEFTSSGTSPGRVKNDPRPPQVSAEPRPTNNLNIAIDPEFGSLINPLSSDELTSLTEQIRRDGCLVPLVIWKTEDGEKILLDGHNRLKICIAHDVHFTTVNMKFPDREHAKLWIMEHQVGRRNLTDDQRTIFWNDIREQRSIIVQKEKMQKAREAKAGVTPISVESPKIDTRAAVVKESGLPVSGFRRAQQLKKHNPEVYGKIRTGELKLRDTSNLIPPKQKKSPADIIKNDFFRHLGHLIDGVFKGTVKDRLDVLMKLKNPTPQQADSTKIIADALDELSQTAKDYSRKLTKFARVA